MDRLNVRNILRRKRHKLQGNNVRNRILTLIEREDDTRVRAIFWFISHTMTYQPKWLGLHIYSWLRQPSTCRDASLRC
jgi:hypothetical protein